MAGDGNKAAAQAEAAVKKAARGKDGRRRPSHLGSAQRTQTPRPGAKLRLELEQNVDGWPLHPPGHAESFGAGATEAHRHEGGPHAAELVREYMIDAVSWGSKRTPATRERRRLGLERETDATSRRGCDEHDPAVIRIPDR